MFTPICVPCAREMRCKKNDYLFKDYEGAAIWAGDRYECERCKASVVVGVGLEPVVEANSRNFEHAARHSGFELTRAAPESLSDDLIKIVDDIANDARNEVKS